MKIQFDKEQDRPLLLDGHHAVRITEVQDGLSENKGTRYFSARFENTDGYVEHRFYDTAPGKSQVLQLADAAGIQVDGELDTQELVGKQVVVEVRERTYHDELTGSERSVKEAHEFKRVREGTDVTLERAAP
ncbi:MAG: hypothetical protein WBA12_02285 [Catalinimonas sp.]